MSDIRGGTCNGAWGVARGYGRVGFSFMGRQSRDKKARQKDSGESISEVCGFHQQQISNLKIRPPLSPEGAERAPSVDGMNRGKRLGGATSSHDDVALPPPVLRFWVPCAYSHTPTAWVAKTPSCRRRPTKPKTEKRKARPGAEAWAWAGQIHNNNNNNNSSQGRLRRLPL